MNGLYRSSVEDVEQFGLKSDISDAQDKVIRARIRAEQVRMLFKQAPRAIFLSIVVAGMVCAVLWAATDHALLISWFAIIIVLALVGLGLVLAYRRRKDDESGVPMWERRFVLSVVLVALTWGVGALFIMPTNSLAYQAIVYFFLMGMVSGAVATYSAHVVLVSLSISSIILPATIRFAFQDHFALQAMALGGIIYTIAAYRATRMLAFFLRRSFQLSHELRIAHEAAQQLARTDELTGMKNRRAFFEMAGLAFEQAKRYGRPVSVIMLDADRFKGINDMRGHAAGDEVIKALGEVIKKTVRATDVAGRLGGEEFAILLTETTIDEAAVMAERLRKNISEISVQYAGSTITFTSSFGVAWRDDECGSLDVLIAQADEALYKAKEGGRNRVACHRRPMPLSVYTR